MSLVVRLGKKNAIYLPREVVEKLNLREGDRLLVEVRDNAIVLRPVPKLFDKNVVFWSSTTVEELEKESEELVRDLEEG